MAPCLISVVFDYLLWLIMDLTYTSITITAIAVITTTFVIVTLIWKEKLGSIMRWTQYRFCASLLDGT